MITFNLELAENAKQNGNYDVEIESPCFKCDIDHKICKNILKSVNKDTFTPIVTITEQCKHYDKYVIFKKCLDIIKMNLGGITNEKEK